MNCATNVASILAINKGNLEMPPTRFHVLTDAIREFERSQSAILAGLPFAKGDECVHPGTLNPNYSKWREQFQL